jgi:hypothetical protein
MQSGHAALRRNKEDGMLNRTLLSCGRRAGTLLTLGFAAFDPITGKFKGLLDGTDGNPIHIDGLWALAFGNDANAGPATTLFFTAGIDHESNGLFGTFTAVENVLGGDH